MTDALFLWIDFRNIPLRLTMLFLSIYNSNVEILYKKK